MIKKTISYEDLDGKTRTEDHYFHLFTKNAALMQAGVEGDLGEFLRKTVKSGNADQIMDEFEKILGKTYGIRTPEGTFELDPEGWKKFIKGQAYDALLLDLINSPSSLSEFILGLFPKGTIDNQEIQKIVRQAEQEIQQVQGSSRPVQDVELPVPSSDDRELGEEETVMRLSRKEFRDYVEWQSKRSQE